MIENVKKYVFELLNNDNSGHGVEHITRVYDLAVEFAIKEGADVELVSLIALLHDVDDYKLFGIKNAEEFNNAKTIMNKVGIDKDKQSKVIDALKTIGYSNSLRGIRPKTIEGMIVSDADMCDALGVSGILRTYQYSIKSNRPFFDQNIYPKLNMNYEEYVKSTSGTGVCHIFEKILRLKDMMLTNAGKEEALGRHECVVNVMYNFFKEERAYDWIEYLDKYLK